MAEFSPEKDRVAKMDAAEIETLFERYDFKDPLGHQLTLCNDFRELVKRATGTRIEEPNPSPEKFRGARPENPCPAGRK